MIPQLLMLQPQQQVGRMRGKQLRRSAHSSRAHHSRLSNLQLDGGSRQQACSWAAGQGGQGGAAVEHAWLLYFSFQ